MYRPPSDAVIKKENIMLNLLETTHIKL